MGRGDCSPRACDSCRLNWARASCATLSRRRSDTGLIQEIPVPQGPFAIVAESFSGPLGIRLATQHRERVRALVLVATFVRNPSPLLFTLGTLLAPVLFRRPPPAFAIRWALLGKDAPASEIAELRVVLRTVPREVLARRFHEMAHVDVSDEFRALEVPVLYLAGLRDRLVGPAAVAELRALRPEMDVCFLDAPHLVLQRKPADAAAAISRFLLTKTGVAGPRS